MSGSPFEFEVVAREGEARAGTLRLAHGDVETPAFMPVGTRGAVRGVTIDELEALGAEIVVASTYRTKRRSRSSGRVPNADIDSFNHRTRYELYWFRSIRQTQVRTEAFESIRYVTSRS